MTNIRFDIPEHIKETFGGDAEDLACAAKEAFLVDLYRTQRITHHQLAEALQLGRIETDGILKRHGITLDFTVHDLDQETDPLRNVRD